MSQSKDANKSSKKRYWKPKSEKHLTNQNSPIKTPKQEQPQDQLTVEKKNITSIPDIVISQSKEANKSSKKRYWKPKSEKNLTNQNLPIKTVKQDQLIMEKKNLTLIPDVVISQSKDATKSAKKRYWKQKSEKNLTNQNLPIKTAKQDQPQDQLIIGKKNITPFPNFSLIMSQAKNYDELIHQREFNDTQAKKKTEDSTIAELLAAFGKPEKSSVDRALDLFKKEFGDKPINKHINQTGQKKQWNTNYQQKGKKYKKNYKPKKTYTAEQTRRFRNKQRIWYILKTGQVLDNLDLHKVRFWHKNKKKIQKIRTQEFKPALRRDWLFKPTLPRYLLTISNNNKLLTFLLNYKKALKKSNKKYTIKSKLAKILQFLITTTAVTKNQQIRLLTLVIKLLTWKPTINTIDKSFLQILNLINRDRILALNFIIELKTQDKWRDYKIAINFPTIFWINLNRFIRYANGFGVKPKEFIKESTSMYFKSNTIVYYNQLRFKKEIYKYIRNSHFREILELPDLSFKEYCTLPNNIVRRFYKRTTGILFLPNFFKGVRKYHYNSRIWVPIYIIHLYKYKYFEKGTKKVFNDAWKKVLKKRSFKKVLKKSLFKKGFIKVLKKAFKKAFKKRKLKPLYINKFKLMQMPLNLRRRQVQQQQLIWTKIFKNRIKTHRRLLLRKIRVWQESRIYILQDYDPSDKSVLTVTKPVDISFKKNFTHQNYNRFFANNTSVFKSVSTFALDLYNNYLDNMVSDTFTIVIRKKKIKTSQIKLVILKFMAIFKVFYTEKQLKRFAKKTTQNKVITLIKSFLRLSGYRHTPYINMQRWSAGSVMSSTSRFKEFMEFIRQKKSLFKVKLVFNKLFLWLYDQAKTKYLLGSKFPKSFLQNHILRTQFIYKKNFKMRLVPTKVVSSIYDTKSVLNHRVFY